MSDNFANASDNRMVAEVKDPLEDLDVYTENPKYNRLDENIFAEPFAIINENKCAEADNEACFIENHPGKKKAGRRKKYIMDGSRTHPSTQCPQVNCGKTFSTSVLLRAHIRRVHCAERNKYMCELCGAGFSARYLLQRHMAVHSAQRVGCPLCGKMLSRRTNMSVHLRRHADIRPHACGLCHRTFVRRSALNTHVRYVHRTEELRCRSCGERFPSRKLLMNHKSCQPK